MATRTNSPESDQQARQVRVPGFSEVLVLAVAGGCVLVVTVVGILLGWDMASLLVLSLIVFPVFRLLLGRVAYSYRTTRKTMSKMLAGEGRVTHWSYRESRQNSPARFT